MTNVNDVRQFNCLRGIFGFYFLFFGGLKQIK